MKFIFSGFAVLLLFSFANAQTGVRGFIKSSNGEALPFSTIYIKGTTNGTTTNASSNYFLKMPVGQHTIVVQHVGYKVIEEHVELGEGQVLTIDFTLEEQALELQAVVISADGENPAYRVIREAIKKRTFYEYEVQAFKNDSYIKGMLRLDKHPDKILGQKVTIDTGIIYFSESVSEFSFERPDKIRERMISSKVSGDDQGFSFNQASSFNINIYRKRYKHSSLGERGFISPISNQAFLFYDYEWLGVFEENGRIINKIKLLPKRAMDPVFDGLIYIIEDSWKFHTVDLLATKSRGLQFTDSLRINQIFAPTSNDIWMPISQKFSFQFGAFGFKGSGYFIGVYSNYEVEPNYELYKKEGLFEPTFSSEEERDLFQKNDFTAEYLYVEDDSNERDSSYWKSTRPIPLTQIEIKDYLVKDSVRQVEESVPYKDSVDRETNKLTGGNVLLSGYTHSNSVKENYWSLPAITSLFQFNTVEGFAPECNPTLWFQKESRTKYWIRPSMRYGLSNKRFNAKIDARYRLLDDKFTHFYAGGGKYISQFNEDESISPSLNSYVTLMSGENYLKLFEKSFGYITFQQELVNGILMNSSLEYATRDTLTNTKTDYYWTRTREVNFTSNQPYNEELDGKNEDFIGTGFATHNALTANVSFRIRFDQRYATRPDNKFIFASHYPELRVTYKRGFVDVNYDFLSLRVSDDLSLGLTGTSTYAIEVGGFLSSKSLSFVDFKHFLGNQTVLNPPNKRHKFELLPFYTYSTGNTYFEAHYEHHFNEFIFNKIPLIRKLNVQMVASANYLTTGVIGNYFELGAGIEHIFKFMRIDYWWAFRDSSFVSNGFRIGVGF